MAEDGLATAHAKRERPRARSLWREKGRWRGGEVGGKVEDENARNNGNGRRLGGGCSVGLYSPFQN
jgi:hypothetical protein